MKKAEKILEALRREYYIALHVEKTLWEDYVEEGDKQKAIEIYKERVHWLYVKGTLRDLLNEFGVEVSK